MELASSRELKKIMKDYFQDLDQAAKDPNQKVAWCTSVGPAEILRAFGYKVFFPENHGALIGVTRKANDYIPYATSLGYSSKICSYLTSDIGGHVKGETPLTDAYGLTELPKPDLLVASDNQCREVEEWLSYYARHYQVPLLVFRSPKFMDEIKEHHVDYLYHECLDFITKCELITNSKLDMELFKNVVRLSAEATQEWKNVLNTARSKPAPIVFFDGTIHMAPIVLMRGTQVALDYYRQLYAELEQCIVEKKSAVEREKYRIYWDGMPVWGKLRRLSTVFAELRASVVASTYCNSWVFDSFDPKDPVRSTALAYAEIFINRSEKYKEAYLLQLCKDFHINGIVYHDAMTCPYNSNNHFGLAERVKQKNNIPFIVIDGDLNDLRCFSEEQSIIKIETFIEQLSQ